MNNIDIYMRDISRHKPLSREKEKEVFAHVKKGERWAINKIINSNLRFVINVASKYRGQGLDIDDLINIGNTGLIRAVESFDLTKGTKFISYAVWWIRQSILKGLAQHSRTIRLPLNKVQLVAKIKKSENNLPSRVGRSPTLKELSDSCGGDVSLVDELLSIEKRIGSIDVEISGEDGKKTPLSESIKDEYGEPTTNLVDKIEEKEYISQLMENLTERERFAIESIFGLRDGEMSTLEEISRVIGLSKERVRQIKCVAIKKMKKKSIFLNACPY